MRISEPFKEEYVGINCGYPNHDFKPTGKTWIALDTIQTEFECSKCGISTSWEVV